MTSWRYQISQNWCLGAKVLWIIYNCFCLNVKLAQLTIFTLMWQVMWNNMCKFGTSVAF